MPSLGVLQLPKRNLRFTHQKAHSPPSGKAWLILSGHISHINGSDSTLVHRQKPTTNPLWHTRVVSANSTGNMPLFRTYSNEQQSLFCYVIIGTGEELYFTCGTGGYCIVTVAEFDEVG